MPRKYIVTKQESYEQVYLVTANTAKEARKRLEDYDYDEGAGVKAIAPRTYNQSEIINTTRYRKPLNIKESK